MDVLLTIRETLERDEVSKLSPFAALSSKSKGRDFPLPLCPLRTVFQRDRDRIIHCKSFRRLKYKTQVFLDPLGDHYRTRLTHTLEVTQIARTLARSLKLNEDLAEAISLVHDIGHAPFGHIGERALDQLLSSGFSHNLHGLRIVEQLENGQGLNLTFEVRDGLKHHSGQIKAATLEGQCVAIADRIAYLNHDIDDAMRANIIEIKDLPYKCVKHLGTTSGKRINTMISDIIKQSSNKNYIRMGALIEELSEELRNFMFDKVYSQGWRDKEEARCYHVIESLFAYYMDHPNELPSDNILTAYTQGHEQAVCDYIAGMTDRFAINQYQLLFVPKAYN